MGKAEEAASGKRANTSDDTSARRGERAEKLAYEKPRLRRYDQIDQVKPYGPSDL